MHRLDQTARSLPVLIVLLAVLPTAAVGDWEVLEQTPWGVEAGAGIAFGADYIWCIFPDPDADMTGFAKYDPVTAHWYQPPGSALEYLANSALTFQSLENGVVYLVGNQPGGMPKLYAYDLGRQSWTREPVIQPSFQLGPGVSVAYVPNLDYNRQLYPVPGWLYCLPADPVDTKQFWRYAIPTSLEPVALDGLYPGNGAVIADMTPMFLWPAEPSQPGSNVEYWIQVATEPTFATPLVSVQTGDTCYQTEEQLPNGTIYWRTASREGGAPWSWGDVHSFSLQGSWSRLADIRTPIGAGAALAYEDDYFGAVIDGMHCLIALVGDDGYDDWRYMRTYDMWQGLSPTSVGQKPGSALATHIFGNGFGKKPKAVFGLDPNAWQHHWLLGWQVWARGATPLPELPGAGASLAYSVDDYVYMVVGEDEQGDPRNGFYRHYAPADDEGERLLGAQGSPKGLKAGFVRLTPGRDRVSIEYLLAAASAVRVSVHDALGRGMGVLFSGSQTAGVHRTSWDLRTGSAKVSPGTYFVLLEAGSERASLKAVVR